MDPPTPRTESRGADRPRGVGAHVRRRWDRVARLYDPVMAILERLWFRGGRRWVGGRARGRVLEVAVGTGRNLPHYADGTEVTGIDASAAMLALARRRAARRGRRVALSRARAEQLPFEDASFDTAVCTLSLCEVPDVSAALSEMHRVLVPGGRLLLLDHVASTWPPLLAAQRALEPLTVAACGEHLTRRPLCELDDAGFHVAERLRSRAGTVERVHAVST